MSTKRTIYLAAAVAAIGAGGRASAQNDGGAAPMLPVREVTLFTSGVGFTERRGTVDADAAVPLTFRVGQINDILKSMVLIDSLGKVQPATYTARDPIGHTLQSFAVDVSGDLTLERVLSQLKGARVAIDSPNGQSITGQIVSVQTRQVAGDDGKPISDSFLNILTNAAGGKDSSLVSIRLGGDRAVRFLDERVNREFRAALGLIASSADDQRRVVTLHFAGAGRREVRVGYVTEAPLWKMSYRLLIGGAAPERVGGKPYMQGWAIVENTTDDDWKDIRLSLVSGRPVSFIEDLYQPLYVPRPEVGPDVIASPTPQTHDSDLQSRRDINGGFGAGAPLFRANPSAGRRSPQGSAGGRGPEGPQGPQGPPGLPEDKPAEIADALRNSVQALAAGQKAGALFRYNITSPVTLPRQQAALIPVVAQDVEAQKVLLFIADSGGKYPLNAVRLHNTTGLHLKGGPVTLFDEGVYAGDARMEDVPPGDTRLLSYAVDLSVEGERQGQQASSSETSISLRRGVLLVARRERIETTYTLKSKSDKARTVLVEHPFLPGYTLIAPAKALERTATVYRFAVELAPGQSQTLKVVVERPISQTVGVVDSDIDTLLSYTTRKEASAKLKAALGEVIQRRRRVQELRAAAANRAQEIQAIGVDQERIRKNMGALDRASSLYKRYVSTLDAQETRIDALRQEADHLRAQAEAADREMRAYVDGLGAVE